MTSLTNSLFEESDGKTFVSFCVVEESDSKNISTILIDHSNYQSLLEDWRAIR